MTNAEIIKTIRNIIFGRVLTVTFIFWISALIVFVFAYYKMINPIYSVVMSTISITVQTFYLFYIIYRGDRLRKFPHISSSSVVIPKGEIKDIFMNANKEILSKNIGSTNPWNRSVFRICFELDHDNLPEFSVIKTYNRNITTKKLSDGIILSKDCTHIFDIPVRSEEKLNFKFNKDVTLKSFAIYEIYIP